MQKATLAVLFGILLIASAGVYMYHSELERQRCAELHRQWTPLTFGIESELIKTCGGLSKAEKAAQEAQRKGSGD